jgi:hypothetical protein
MVMVALLQLRAASFKLQAVMRRLHVGAAEGCDLLILKINGKRSQPSAAPTSGCRNIDY